MVEFRKKERKDVGETNHFFHRLRFFFLLVFSSPLPFLLHHGRPRRLYLVQQRRGPEREPGAQLSERLEKGQKRTREG